MPRGEHRWNNGKIISSHGYAKVRVGRGHPLADPNGYAYEHLIIWVASGNERPNKDELIHHINGNKTDNRIENLELMKRSIHNKHHNKEKGRDTLGRFVGKKSAGGRT